MESVEEMCDHIALIHESNKILDGKLIDIKRQNKTNTFEIGLMTPHEEAVLKELQGKFEVSPAQFKSINDELMCNIKLGADGSANDLIQYCGKGQLTHFKKLCLARTIFSFKR